VARAVKVCQGAGVRVVMITGDYQGTARSVAEKVRLSDGCVDEA
jgi:magnesium-transporting ATPase (P-type)